jgi:hypothetical protein
MFNQFNTTWNIIKQSSRVLQADKELVIFPVISSIGVIIVTATFFLPLFLTNAIGPNSNIGDFFYLVTIFLFYLAQYFVIFFCNTALVGAALIRLKGGDPTVKDGINIAVSRFGPILGYALIAATVGMILKAISGKKSGLKQLIVSLVGTAWNIATFLVVPVLAAENVGPIEAVKRSAALLKKTWGEQLIGNFGLGTFFSIITVVTLVIFVPFIILFINSNLIPVSIFLGVILLLALAVIGLANSTLSGIYAAAVYNYTANGEVGTFFENDMVRNAFSPRRD